jgi:ABC-type transport system substrate-binding protein
MKGIPMKLRIFLATAATLALAACGKSAPVAEATGDATAAATTEAAPATAAPASAAPAAAGGTALTETYLLGKWADVKDGDCKLAQGFLAGGKVDGLFDSWKIEGSNLVLGMMGENQSLSVKIIDQKTMETKNGTSEPHTLTRC